MTTLRERFWIWGHDPGCHHNTRNNVYKLPGVNRMDSLEGARYLGIPNCCRVVYGGKPERPFDSEAEKLTPFRQVVWSILGDAGSKRNDNGGDDLAEVLRLAEKYPNIQGGILDDFFRPQTKDARFGRNRLAEIRDSLHHAPRPLELWLVYYAGLLDIDYTEYLKLCDNISFWSWTGADLANAEKNLDRIIAMTPGKKHYAGCYLYNYGDIRPITAEEMEFQLELYRKRMMEQKIQGVIVCSNNVVDIGLEAPEILRKWLVRHGDEVI